MKYTTSFDFTHVSICDGAYNNGRFHPLPHVNANVTIGCPSIYRYPYDHYGFLAITSVHSRI